MRRAVHWFRNDLRLRDNTALWKAVRGADRLACVFVLDDRLLLGPGSGAPRSRFLLDSLARLERDLASRGQRLVVRRGSPVREMERLLEETRADVVTWNRDTTPYARRRDSQVRQVAGRRGVRVVEPKDRVVFEAAELRTRSGGAFTRYTPYRNAWWRRWSEDPQEATSAPVLPPPLRGVRGEAVPDSAALAHLGHAAERGRGTAGGPMHFGRGAMGAPARRGAAGGGARSATAGEAALRALERAENGTQLPAAGEAAGRRRLRAFLESGLEGYAEQRDAPAVEGTSRLSPYLRFGAVSIRECVGAALEAARAEPRLTRSARRWVDELIWRELYAALLEEHPDLPRRSFRREYEAIRWSDDEEAFAAWCEGRTGYPFVDAGMRQLARTGWMHNRARMAVASFLVKDLWIDWRRGERFFFQRLVDGDLASNAGGWQWVAATGPDAPPYFRIFNPVAQGRRFDPDGAYVRRHVPELRSFPRVHVHEPWKDPPRAARAGYPAPRVSHAERRTLALSHYRAARRPTGAPARRRG